METTLCEKGAVQRPLMVTSLWLSRSFASSIQEHCILQVTANTVYTILVKKILKMGGLCTCILIINDERQERTQLLAYNV